MKGYIIKQHKPAISKRLLEGAGGKVEEVVEEGLMGWVTAGVVEVLVLDGVVRPMMAGTVGGTGEAAEEGGLM